MDKGNELAQDQVKKFLLANVRRIVTNLFKEHLVTCSDLNQEYLSRLIRNKDKISPEVYEQLAWWNTSVMGNIRKKTLDKGNDSIREIEKLFDFVDVELNHNYKE